MPETSAASNECPPTATTPTGGRGGATRLQGSQATPLIINGIMYIASPYGRMVALERQKSKVVFSVRTAPESRPTA